MLVFLEKYQLAISGGNHKWNMDMHAVQLMNPNKINRQTRQLKNMGIKEDNIFLSMKVGQRMIGRN